MELKDAIATASKIKSLKGRDAVALHVLLELARRVHRSKRAIRSLANALDPQTALNQESLFRDE